DDGGLRQYSYGEGIKIGATDRGQSLALAIESIRQRAKQSSLGGIGPQRHVEGHQHSDGDRYTGKSICHGPAKVLRVEGPEVKRVEKSDDDIEPGTTELKLVQSDKNQRSRQCEEQ